MNKKKETTSKRYQQLQMEMKKKIINNKIN